MKSCQAGLSTWLELCPEHGLFNFCSFCQRWLFLAMTHSPWLAQAKNLMPGEVPGHHSIPWDSTQRSRATFCFHHTLRRDTLSRAGCLLVLEGQHKGPSLNVTPAPAGAQPESQASGLAGGHLSAHPSLGSHPVPLAPSHSKCPGTALD